MKSISPSRIRKQKVEWVGGRVAMPEQVADGDFVFRPDALVWLELPALLIVGTMLTDPREPRSLGDSLLDAMKSPLVGAPRRPSRIRVPDQRAADELGTAASGIPVFVAPVPELDEVVAGLVEAFRDAAPELSYFGNGEVEPQLVEELFKAAGILFRAAPWRNMSDEQILRVDIPTLGVAGACISIIGAAGDSFGLTLFSSLDDFEAFLEAAQGVRPRGGDLAAHLALRSLSFDPKDDFPPSLLREIEEHRLPVAGADGYPVLFCVNGDLSPLPVTSKDVRILTAVTRAFLFFFARNRDLFDHDEPEPVREIIEAVEGVKVTITAPYVVLENEEPSHATVKREVGRNDPCPCGSGKKYKKCHLEADQTPRRTVDETVHEMDERLVRAILEFSARRYGPGWIDADLDDEDQNALQLLIPWVMWTASADGEHVAGAWYAEHLTRLSDDEREWFMAQQRAWLSVWEVTAVEPGRIEIRDLLTSETRSVREDAASRTVVPRDSLLARVIDYRGESYLGGMHQRVLSPTTAARVVDLLRRQLRRKTAVPAKRLQNMEIGWSLIDHWSEEVELEDRVRQAPLILQNGDGDPLLFITDSYAFDVSRRAEIEKRLRALADFESAKREKGERVHVYVRPSDSTVIGRVIAGAGALRIETNSENRAAVLAERVEQGCAGMLRRIGRSIEPPSPSGETAATREEPPSLSSVKQAVLLEYKEIHYRKWIDEPIPALGGKTPRAASRFAKGRIELDLLLRDLENLESRFPKAARYDVNRIRKELGLEE